MSTNVTVFLMPAMYIALRTLVGISGCKLRLRTIVVIFWLIVVIGKHLYNMIEIL